MSLKCGRQTGLQQILWTWAEHSTAVQAIQLSGQLNGKPVRFMLDSGAMGNFLSSEWVKSSGVRAASRISQKVFQLPDGSWIPSNAVIPRAFVTLLNSRIGSPHYQERLSFDLADLQGYDAILGKPWLDKHNPSIDWKSHTVTISK